MISNNGMFLFFKRLFLQLLSSLNLVDGVPVGMSDSVGGNDAVFTNGHAWTQTGTASYQAPASDDLKLDNFQFTYYDELLGGNYHMQCCGDNTDKGWICGFFGNDKYQFILRGLGNSGFFGAENINFDDYGIIRQPGLFYKITIGRYSNNIFIKVADVLLNQLTNAPTGSFAYNNNPFVIGGFLYGFTSYSMSTHYGIKLEELNTSGNLLGTRAHWPMPFAIETAANDISFDVVNGNNAVLLNGDLLGNRKIDRVSYYSQLGFYQSTTQKVPIKADLTEFADGTPLNDPDAIYESNAFINSGEKLKQPEVAELINADVDKVYFDSGGNAKEVTFAEIENAIANNPNVYGGEVVSGKSIKNISLK